MKNKILTFLALVVLTFVLTHLTNVLLNIESVLKTSLAESLTKEQIDEFLDFQSNWQWLSYAVLPLLLLLKISLISAIIKMGCFFFDKEIKFKTLFNIVVKAEFVFLLVVVLKTAWFYFFQTNYTLEDLKYFYPLSAINILGYEGLDPWWVYPFQVLNLFELAYWFILAYLIGKQINSTTDKGLTIVASSYGVALLIWVVGVMFFTLNVS